MLQAWEKCMKIFFPGNLTVFPILKGEKHLRVLGVDGALKIVNLRFIAVRT
jgi:hypothetical protein